MEGARKERKRGVGWITRVRWFREEEEEGERERQREGREIRVRWVRNRDNEGEMVGGEEDEEQVGHNAAVN